ncbi:dihydrodipicolinate synthase family protein [Rhodococcoides kyotonense]|uniref:4-hydroxy-tetrahydrodipicolinate synthase n=1 Tax=Rhodococcoides kyotonense TaxID=398843 RepID=A0A239N7M4_9NOCA|nr:dihydrodipicolinate synthase family protein [Rhodococcus kyotonensis]SNT50740.1 4-hydroxy-tetrahydrodipicolinate synthase [Rhodococcus kyotonensis]
MKPWHGIVVASAIPMRTDLSIDYDKFQEHVAFLAANGCHGITPNGSLGEYQVLTDEERAKLVELAVEAAPDGFSVVPGVSAYGSAEATRWAQQAADAGAHAVLCLPPNSYKANADEIFDHYKAVGEVGIPIVAYNNPFDTNVDLSPDLVARLAEIEQVVAIKEFSGDVRRVHEIANLAPSIDIIAGADDVVVECLLMGAVGWIGGFSNSMPLVCAKLYEYATTGEVDKAVELYRTVHAAFQWDSRHTFIQAIKLSMDMGGRYGGPCRPPRHPLSSEDEAQARKDFERAFAVNV